MEHLDGILKLVEKELGAVDNNGKFRSREDIDSVYKLIDIAKDIYCIWDYEEEEDDSSFEGPRYGDRGVSYNDGMSYARGRRNARRDSMGRYSRRGYSMGGDKDEYIERLREAMESAPDEQHRQKVHRMIQELESM